MLPGRSQPSGRARVWVGPDNEPFRDSRPLTLAFPQLRPEYRPGSRPEINMLTQVRRVRSLNAPGAVTREVVEIAREVLVIGAV